MVDIASLGIAVDSRQVRAADRDLDKLANTGKRTEKQTDLIGGAFKRLAAPLAAFLSARQVVQYADQWTNLNNRLSLVTDSTEELAIAQRAVFDIAQDTRQSLTSSAELYQRIATNADELGLSLNEVSGVVETISQTLVISGASAQSASAALVQLGQAFASGTLRGEELNSVLEQAPALAKALAEGMGVSIGQLRELGQAGKLTSQEVIDALQRMSASVEEDFSKTSGTVGQAFQKLENSLIRTIGTFDKATGASNGFAESISGIADAIERMGRDGGSESRILTLTELLDDLRETRGEGGFFSWLEDNDRRIPWAVNQLIQLRAQRDLLADSKPIKFEDVIFDMDGLKESFDAAGAGLEKFSQESIEANERIQRAEQNRLAGIEDIVAGIEKQAATLGYTAEQLAIYELSSDGATAADLKRVRAAYDLIDAYEDQLEVLKEIEQQTDDSFAQFEDELIKGEKNKFEDLLGDGKEAFDEMSVYAKRAAENMQDAFADFLFDPFEDGLDGMLANFGRIIQRMAAEASAAMIFESIGEWGKANSGGGSVSGGTSGNGTDWLSTIAGFASMFSYEGGGFTGGGPRTGGLDGRGGMMAMVHPNETIIDHTKGQSAGGFDMSGSTFVFPGVRTEREAQQASGAMARQMSRLAQNNRYS